jgi:hypothetical protein
MSKSEIKKVYHKNGNIYMKKYIWEGGYHREDGPAVIVYDENGNKYRQAYYISGKYLTKEEWYSKLTTKQKVNLLYGKGFE